ETADVEQVLVQSSSLNLFVQAFLTAKANSFENILEPFYKILRISPQIARGIAMPTLFQRLLDRLAHPKAVVRLNLLRILRAIFDVHPERIQLVDGYGMSQVVVKISEEDPSVLVKELAKEILDAFEESDSEAALSGPEDEDDYIVGVAGRGADTNGYNSFASAGDFFGLLQSNMYVKMLNSSAPNNEHLDAVSGSAEQSLQNGVFSSLDIHGDVGKGPAKERENGRPSPQHATSALPPVPLKGSIDLSQKQVEELGIKSSPETGTVFLASSRQKEWNRSPAGSSSLEITSASVAAAAADIVASQQRIRRYSSDSNQSSESDGLDDHFVTSRGWIGDEGDHPEDIKVEVSDPTLGPQLNKAPAPVLEQVQSSQITITENQSRPSSDSIAASRRRRFGHQKSKSLGEILELNLDEDIAKSQQVLEGVHLDQLSDSMILRSEMPKIRLELLDIDQFPAWNRRELEANYEDDDEEDEQNSQTYQQRNKARGGLFRDRNDSWRGIATEPESIGGNNSTGTITTSISSSHRQLASVRRATTEGSSVRFSSPIPPPFDPQEQERPSSDAGGEIRMTRVSEPSSSSTLSSTSQSSESTSASSPPSTITTSFIQRTSRDFGTSSSWDGAYTTCKESRASEESSATSSSDTVPSQMRAGSMATAAAAAVSPTTTTTTKVPSFMQGLFENAVSPTLVTSSSKPRLDRRSSKSEDGYGYDYGYLRQHFQQQRHNQMSPTLLSPTTFSPTRQGFKADSDPWDFQTRVNERDDHDELEDEEEEEGEQEYDDEEEDEESEEEEDWDKEFQLDVQPTVRLSLNGPSRTIAHPLDNHHNGAYIGYDNDHDHGMDDSEEEEEEDDNEEEDEDDEDDDEEDVEGQDESDEDEESEEQDEEEPE
ncbi:hypothetical protein BG000_005192, partial [Podila horticola]